MKEKMIHPPPYIHTAAAPHTPPRPKCLPGNDTVHFVDFVNSLSVTCNGLHGKRDNELSVPLFVFKK